MLVAHLCPTLCDPMDTEEPAVHGILQARILHSLLQEIFQTQRLIPGLLHCRQILYHLSHQGVKREMLTKWDRIDREGTMVNLNLIT